MRTLLTVALTLLALSLPALGWTGTLTPELVTEVEQSFKFNGKPIHPALLQNFESWLSDPGLPLVVAVDVAAASDTNQYADGEVSVDRNDFVTYKRNFNTYGYHYEGRLKNGLIIVRSWNQPKNGSGVFQTLFFLRLAEGKGWLADGKPYGRLVLSCERAYPLGDRTSVSVQLKDNEVHLKIKAFPSGKSSNVILKATAE